MATNSAIPNATSKPEKDSILVKIDKGSSFQMSGSWSGDDDFFTFCQDNPELRIERNTSGQITIMPPTTSETGRRNSKIHIELGIWNKQTGLGETFDSSTGFSLPNGANRSPDTAWISKERWRALPENEKQRFAAIVPDFVIELRSEDHSLSELRQKMNEYMQAGCRLAWLIDPQNKRTEVYADNGDQKMIPFDAPLSGDSVLPGFTVLLAEIFR